MKESIWRAQGFKAFLVIAFLNAFTDLGHKIIIQNTLFKYYHDPELRIYTALINAMILLPFIMAFTPAGFISDKFPKHWIIRASAFLAVPITALITLCYYLGWFWPAFWLTFILALQSALYSPAKFGYIRELVGKENLAPGNSVVQAVSIVAILSGTIVYTVIFEALLAGHHYTSMGEILEIIKYAGFLLIIGSIVEFYLSFRLPLKRAYDKALRFEWGHYARAGYLKHNLNSAWTHQGIWLSIIGLSVFWAVNQVALVTFPAYLKEVVGETDTRVANGLMALSGIGIVLGAIFAGKVSKNYIETGIIPLGALGMFLGLFCIPFLTDIWLLGILFMAYGFCGGLFVVPLNSLIQYHAKDNEGGTMIAARNFIENIFMLTFLGLSIGIAYVGIASKQVFFMLSLVVLIGAVYAVLKLPQSLIRYVITGILNRRYRVQVTGMENIPTRGGVLLLGNHVSWLDWAMLQIACPRPIRFVMARVYYEKWYIKWLLDLFKVIPIAGSASKDALESVRDALLDGEVVALFPEGHISHNGHLSVFKSGFARAVQGTDAAIVPFYLRGLWGSRFSYVNSKYREASRGGDIRHISVGFGAPLPSTSSTVVVKQAVLATALHTWEEYIATLAPLPVTFVRVAKGNLRRLAVLEARNDFTYARLLTAAIAFRGVLQTRLAGQQNIGVLLPASAGAVLADMAVLMLGKTIVNLNYTAPLAVVAASARQAGIQTILTSRLFLKKLEQRGLDMQPLQDTAQLLLLEDLKAEIPKRTLLAAYAQTLLLPAPLLLRLYVKAVPMDAVAAILFSSGSEGTPKGVMLTHANIMANIKQAAAILNAGDEDVMLNSLPVFHSFGLTVTTLLPLLEGMPMVCQPDPTDAKAVGQLAAQYKVTLMFATSTFLRLYTRNRKLHPLMFESLRLVIAGAERLAPEVREAFWLKFGKHIYEGYGTTETAPVTNCNIPDVLLSYDGQVQIGNKPGTVGLPIPGTHIRIVDPDTLAELPVGEAGLVLVGGPQVMPGYLNDEAKTRAALIEKDGQRWYKTGDKGQLDEDGFLTIVDRYSRFAKIGGEMISLSALEGKIQEIIANPDIDILAVAVADAAKGEKIVLLVAGAEDIDALKNQVRASGLNPLMQPHTWLAVASVPRLGSGKADFTAAAKLAQVA
jgi:acyl-[acyl-carrier-protein]-phospholipid O-acyltransferase / long-chain-fatty-acid--[acyl-carrier-protein] ligase